MKTHRFLIYICLAATISGCTNDYFTPNIPEVRTLEATDLTDCSATLKGEYSTLDLYYKDRVTDGRRYFYVSDSPHFTAEDIISDQYCTLSDLLLWNSESCHAYDLTPGTTYYYAFALSDGVAEVRGETKTFTTLESQPATATLNISHNEFGFIFNMELSGIKNGNTFYLEFCNDKEESLTRYRYTRNLGINGTFEETIEYSNLAGYFEEYTILLCRLGYETYDEEQIVLTDFQEVTMQELPKTYWTASQLFLYDSETDSYSDGEYYYLYLTYDPVELILHITHSVEGWFDVSFFAGDLADTSSWGFHDSEEHSFDYSSTREVPDFTADDGGYWIWNGDLEEACHTSGTLFIRNNRNNHYLKISEGSEIVRQ